MISPNCDSFPIFSLVWMGFLSPLNFDSLALKVWGYASEAFFAEAALPALILILLSGPASAYLVLRRNDIEESV